jgi:hypothetical protein
MIAQHLIEAGVVHHAAKVVEDTAIFFGVAIAFVFLLIGLGLGHMIGKRRR